MDSKAKAKRSKAKRVKRSAKRRAKQLREKVEKQRYVKAIQSMSKDCWLLVMSFIEEDQDFFVMARVSRYFNQLFESPWLWRRRTQTHWQPNVRYTETFDLQANLITSRRDYVYLRRLYARVELTTSPWHIAPASGVEPCDRLYHDRKTAPLLYENGCVPVLIPCDVVQKYEEERRKPTIWFGRSQPVRQHIDWAGASYNSQKVDAHHRRKRQLQQQQDNRHRRKHDNQKRSMYHKRNNKRH